MDKYSKRVTRRYNIDAKIFSSCVPSLILISRLESVKIISIFVLIIMSIFGESG